MATEIEILSGISPEQFKQASINLEKKFGKPKVQKRFGIIFGSYEEEDRVDTRIKITNGIAHLVQKWGSGSGLTALRSKEELDLKLNLNYEELFDLIRVFKNVYKDRLNKILPIQQFDNLIFDTPDAEVKLYRQFNTENMFYGFEVELKDNSLDVYEICSYLGLEPDNIERDADYWHEYDRLYNTNGMEMNDRELVALIRDYMQK